MTLWSMLRRRLRDLPPRARGALEILFAEILFAGCQHGRRIHASGWVRVTKRGDLRLADRVVFRGGPVRTELVCQEGASLEFGEGTYVNYGCSFDATASVRVGRRCMFGKYVQVHDSSPEGTAPIVIGDDVWVAHAAIILPGVRIGDGSIVSAGSVVTSDVPPLSIAVGNPARSMSLRLRTREEGTPPSRARGGGGDTP